MIRDLKLKTGLAVRFRLRSAQALCVALLATAVAPGLAQAQAVGADLNVSPPRVIFNATSRADTVLVYNRGSQSATYNIELVDRIMTPDGRLQSLAEAGTTPDETAAKARLKSAHELINFSPRRVTLPPGEGQTIRLRVLRPADLATGEYRSHLTITAVPDQDQGLTAEQAAGKGPAGGIGVKLTALFSVSVPLFVRQGTPDLNVTVSGVKYNAPEKAGQSASLVVDVQRSGSMTAYGDIVIEAADASASAKPLAQFGGIGVYPEIDHRSVDVQLARPLTHGEKVRISFKDRDLKPGQPLASAIFTAP